MSQVWIPDRSGPSPCWPILIAGIWYIYDMETLINRRLRVMVLLVRRVASSSRRCIRFTGTDYLPPVFPCEMQPPMGCVMPSGMWCGRLPSRHLPGHFLVHFCMHIRIGACLRTAVPPYATVRTRLLGYTPPVTRIMNAYLYPLVMPMWSVKERLWSERRTCQLMICLQRIR